MPGEGSHAMAELRVALVGYKFMGKAHSHAYRNVAAFFDVPLRPAMQVLVGRDQDAVRRAAERWGWREAATDWREAVRRDDVELVDVCTPGDWHAPIAIEAAKAGKHVFCEKPLANTLAEAEQMAEVVTRAGVTHMVAFNYRRVPAVVLARRLIEQGALGQIYHFRAVYLQDWIVDPGFPLVWRLRREKAGSGPLGDLGAHLIDLARYLVGEIVEVVSTQKTFIAQRPLPAEDMGAWGSQAGTSTGQVTVEDAALFLAHFANGALGSFEATRFAPGRRNYNCFEINGSKGSLRFNLERLNELEFFDRDDPADRQGWRTILVTDAGHPYVDAWWPPGHTIGWEHTFVHEVKDLLEAIAAGKPASPDFVDGLQCQSVLESVSESARKHAWVSVRQFTRR